MSKVTKNGRNKKFAILESLGKLEGSMTKTFFWKLVYYTAINI